MSTRSNTIILALLTCLLWSSVYPTVKIGLASAPPFHFAGARFLLAGIMLVPLAGSVKSYISMISEHRRLVFYVTMLQIVINYSLFYSGLKLVPAAIGAVIVGAQPLITAIVSSAMIKSERLSSAKIITIIAGLSGVVLISAGRQAFHMGETPELLGILMLLTGNLSTSVSNVLISAGSRRVNPLVLNSFSLISGGTILMAMSLVFEKQPGINLPASYWITLSWLSMVAAAGFSIWYKLLQRPGVKVSELNLWKFLIPGLGAILSWVFLPAERPDWLTISGIIIISASLIVFFRVNTSRLYENQ